VGQVPSPAERSVTAHLCRGLSNREIAAKLSITENTVEKQMGKGIRLCTEFFARRGLP
jgi:DNA-binding CsgD family transcriptional regulator